MNLLTFLNEVDKAASAMSRETLISLLHEISRKVPENEREKYLSFINSYNNDNKNNSGISANDTKANKNLKKETEEIINILSELENGDRYFDSEYDPSWGEWYNYEGNEVMIVDNFGIKKDINKAVKLIHKCIDAEMFEEGYKLASALANIKILIMGDYEECYGDEFFYISDCDDFEIISNYNKLCLEILYLVYMEAPLSNRSAELYSMIDTLGCSKIKLEQIMLYSKKERPDEEEFLALWIEYLSKQEGLTAEEYLREACSMLKNSDSLIQFAASCSDLHPELYVDLLLSKINSGENEKMLCVGKQALEQIPTEYEIRSDAAHLTARYALKIGDKDFAEKCWLEAFRSKPSALNYMYLKFESNDYSAYENEVNFILENAHKDSKYNSRKYQLSNTDYFAVLFFEEKFDKIIENTIPDDSVSLLSSYNIKLITLLIYQSTKIDTGISSMIRNLDFFINFENEISALDELNDNSEGVNVEEKVLNRFFKWKKDISISEEFENKIIEIISDSIEQYVDLIMRENCREDYPRCALYIAALGEALESSGKISSKQIIMEEYKNKYPRRRLFISALKECGMK